MLRKQSCAGLLGLAWVFCPTGVAQHVLPTAGSDLFVKTIEAMKHSVISLDCLAVGGEESRILDRMGSAFLISMRDFLTAAHVVMDMQKGEHPCPTPAIMLPVDEWRPDDPTEQLLWFPFKISACRADRALDIAVCPLGDDLANRQRELRLRIAPVEFDWHIPPDGAPVAFTGFPLQARDPMTFRANVAAHRTPFPDEPIPEMIIDRQALPGFSGSPIYLADGRVVAVAIRLGKDETLGITIARPVSVLREMLRQQPQK